MSAGEGADPAFEALLDFLTRSRGFDFTAYRRASLARRFERRMQAVGCAGFGDYLDYLEVHPDEYEQLFDTLLINVTEFFRDPPAWQHLSDEILPELLSAKRDDEPIRVWSAGCAGGQEAYTAAIVLAEALGDEAFHERVKIYGTDVDEDALATARQGAYTEKELSPVPEPLRARYFEPADGRLAFRKELRRAVIFGRNDLISDAPISRLDLLICRNTLMYFTAETQARILRHFRFALHDRGVLMLGRSETLISHRDAFTAVGAQGRIFRKVAGTPSLLERLVGGAEEAAGVVPAQDDGASRDAALELGPHPELIVSRTGRLTLANLPARALFGIRPEDVGRGFSELDVSHTPVELGAAMGEAVRARHRVSVGQVEFRPSKGAERLLEVTVLPLLPDGGAPAGVAVVFEDVSRYASLERELESNRRDLELAYEELQSTIDELETTNEGLQSANEELQTTNEELETMNEELQSTNEELETINDELRRRTGGLDRANDFLEAILTSLGIGVAVVDREQRVQIWNRRAEDLWGVRHDEALEHHLLSLDFGLPVERLAMPLRTVLGGGSERESAVLEAVNRRGRAIGCATTILPLRTAGGDGSGPVHGAVILMEEEPAG